MRLRIGLHLQTNQYANIAHFEVSSQTWNIIYVAKPLHRLSFLRSRIHETRRTDRYDRPPPAIPALAAASGKPYLTHVELFWQEGVREHWLRFGRQAGDRIINRRRRVVSFAPGAIFAFIRWAANDYGTVSSQIAIMRAVSRGEAFSTLPHVDPGGEILLHLHGWPKVEQVLRTIDAIEALGIAPEDVAPNHWRHIHNRLAAGLPPRSYSLARHRAWLLREGFTP